jgi:hypothetical protein
MQVWCDKLIGAYGLGLGCLTKYPEKDQKKKNNKKQWSTKQDSEN